MPNKRVQKIKLTEDITKNQAVRTIESELNIRRNNFGFIRFFLALLVIIHHAYPLGGFGEDPFSVFTRNQESLGGVAVMGFFITSGFLITKSMIDSTSIWRYMWHRFLRILPAYWVCILITSLGFATYFQLINYGTVDNYLRVPDGPFAYLRNNVFIKIRQFGIADTLPMVPYPNSINGSLWTLIYEIMAYSLIGLFGVMGIFKLNRYYLLLMFLIFYTFYIIGLIYPSLALYFGPWFADPQLTQLLTYFFTGTMFYIFKKYIPLYGKLVVIALLITIASSYLYLLDFVLPITLAYILFWLVAKLPLSSFTKYGDFSYGLYIYAFPVQQTLSFHGLHRYGMFIYIILTVLLTMLLAVASWYCIEQPALRYKNKKIALSM